MKRNISLFKYFTTAGGSIFCKDSPIEFTLLYICSWVMFLYELSSSRFADNGLVGFHLYTFLATGLFITFSTFNILITLWIHPTRFNK